MVKPRRALALYLSSCLLSALPALAPLQAQAEQVQGDQPTRACSQPQGTLDETIASCSAVIEAGSVSGRELAAAYAQRGFARTLKRDLAKAETDLNEAVKLAPDPRKPMSTAPISGP
jgi:hypothetical protein